jgi:hypothetical protein
VTGAVGDLVVLIRNTMRDMMSQGGGIFADAGLSAGAHEWGAAQKGPLQDAARAAAAEFKIDPDVFLRQINQESGFNTSAISSAGARGIAQFMPQTGEGAAKNLGVSSAAFWADPTLQLRGAAQLDQSNLTRYSGDYDKMLAAYNAGAGNVDKYGGVPPFDETRRYVSSIMGHAAGGWLSEPILGVSRSGQLHSFAENGPERVVRPGSTGGGAGPLVLHSSVSAPITVVAGAGQSPEEIGQAVSRALELRIPKALGDFAKHFEESLDAIPAGGFS